MTRQSKGAMALRIKDYLQDPRRIESLTAAIPQGVPMDGQRLVRDILSLIQISRQADMLLQSDPKSLYTAALTIAHWGLKPELGCAWVIPRRNKDRGTVEANAQIGYKGLIQLLWRTGKVKGIHFDVVMEGDVYEYWIAMDGIHFRHEPISRLRPCGKATRNGPPAGVTHAYAIVHMLDGAGIVEAMPVAALDAHRFRYSQQPSGRNAPWEQQWDIMAATRCLIRLFKRAEFSTSMTLAQSVMDRLDRGLPSPRPVIDEETGEVRFVDVDGDGDADDSPPQAITAPPPPVQTGLPIGAQAEAVKATQAPNAEVSERWEPTPEEQAKIRAREEAEAADIDDSGDWDLGM